MKISIASVFLSILALSESTVVHDSHKGITYKGTTSKVAGTTISSFLNIPFAESVAGPKRFTKPIPKSYAPGAVIDASKPGPACPQQKVPVDGFALFSNVTNVSEDCLNLRVDRVETGSTSKGKLPVYVWIYGGGDSIGQVYDQIYDPSALLAGAAEKNTPVIYVAMNYRLNIFGFAASSALSAEGNTNLGLRDQRAALQWVQEHIAAFGGDPDNVTLAGESDGATGVGLQLASFGGVGKAPFRRVIMESGSAAADAGVASNFTATNTQTVAESVGCNKKNDAETLACLRGVPYQVLFNATYALERKLVPFTGFDVFIPTAGDDFIPGMPSELIRSGRFHREVDAVIGWTVNDGALFVPGAVSNESDIVNLFHKTRPGLSKSTVAKLFSLYPASEFQAALNASSSFYRASRMVRDLEFTCPSVATAKAITHYSSSATTYLYQLDQTPFVQILEEAHAPFAGVIHFSDIPYVFNDPLKAYGATDADISLANAVSGSWAHFANKGTPSSPSSTNTLGPWPKGFGKKTSGGGNADLSPSDTISVLTIGGPSGTRPVTVDAKTQVDGLNRFAERCAFLTTPEIFAELAT